MKGHLGLSSILGGGAVVMMMTQPALAAATQVTAVEVSETDAGVEVILRTRDGDRPQIFTVTRGNSLTADIINTELALPDGNGFLQNNPAPGISSIMVATLDANSIRVTVTGEVAPPVAQIDQQSNRIVLAYDTDAEQPAASEETAEPSETAAAEESPIESAPDLTQVPGVEPDAAEPTTQAPAPQSPAVPPPDVMVPNPEVLIDGVPAQASAPTSYVPPLQSRAIAPPLGDIAVSNIDTSPSSISLGTTEVVPRLVLRDAPVRDVLSLLARAAGLNVAYIGDTGEEDSTAAAAPDAVQSAVEAASEVRVSLDIENEPIENVFNYVLRVADLEANRVGRTIFVGPRLPDGARNVIARTLRLNQVGSLQASTYLATLGAETRQFFQAEEEVEESQGNQTTTTTRVGEPSVVTVEVEPGDSPLLLQGLSVTADERLNSITLVGSPNTVETAVALLSQIDLRQRQVAINVKIVDVNLLATEDFSTSFSFGWDDGFFVSDGGAASFNYGGVNPPSQSDVNASRLSPPVTGAPFPPGVDEVEPFLDAQPNAPFGVGDPQTFSNPALNDGSIQVPSGTFFRGPFGTESNPFQGGVTQINPDGTIEIGLPQLFQFPTDFLFALESQIVSGNAKILTDPTLVIQEGQAASVVLAQDVITNVTINRDFTSAGVSETVQRQITPAGLTLDIAVSRIDDNGFITLEVNPSVTSPTQTVETEGGDAITLLARRDLRSGRIRIRDSQTLILSGIIQETDRTTVSKVPILGDIPILGALFRSTNRENTRQEVIVLLTPQILDDSDVSTFGYRYTPSEDAQEVLQRQGVQVP